VANGVPGAADVVGDAPKARETLSQFVVRILGQLSLSAWLPSAALVLSILLVGSLGSALEAPNSASLSVGDAIGDAFASFDNLSVADGLLLFAGVVVLTMLTQAFSFESIRLLEGYWGTNRAVERIADLRCRRHRKVRERLDTLRSALVRDAWMRARSELDVERVQREASGGEVEVTSKVLDLVGARALGDPSPPATSAERETARRVQWERKAPPELIRRLSNVDKRLRGYPRPVHVLPTRLGNMLRSHEDRAFRGHTGAVEGAVQRVFDSLPSSLQTAHDRQRTRLDLYCSMVVVAAVVTVVAVVVLWSEGWYPAAAVALGVAAMQLNYRAAVASAGAYGGILEVIGKQTAPRRAAAAAPMASEGSGRSAEEDQSGSAGRDRRKWRLKMKRG
jgi:hypothetical protein